MGWIEREQDKHQHDMPEYFYPDNGDGHVARGDKWQCDCGKTFEVTDPDLHLDMREGDFYKPKWMEVPKYAEPLGR